MLKRLLIFLLAACSISRAACSSVALPTDYLTAAGISRSNLAGNFSVLRDAHNTCAVDSLNLVLGVLSGFSGRLLLASNQDMALKIDADNNGTNRFAIQNGANDTAFRVGEDLAWKFFGAGVGTKLTLSDSILAVTARMSGNASVGGAFGVTGASTLAALSATTGSFSSTLTANAALNVGASGSVTLAYMTASRIPYTGASSDLTTTSNLTYTPGTTTFATANGNFSGALTVTGASTLGSLLQLANNATNAYSNLTTPSIYSTGTSGGAYPFLTAGNLVLEPRLNGATRDVIFMGSSGVPSAIVTGGGRLGVGAGPTAPTAIGSFYGGSGAAAGIILGTNLTDATNKEGRLKSSHYTNAEEPVTMAWLSSTSSTSILSIGGNSSLENAATAIDFYTASNNTTVTGTRRGGFSSSGAFDVTGAFTAASNITQSAGTHSITVTDNTADAVDVQEGTNNYINVNTTNSAEDVAIGNTTTNPTVRFLGTGTKTASGKLLGTDTVAASLGLRVGSAGATDVSLYRGSGDMWATPDSLTVTGVIRGSDTVVAARGLRAGGGEAFVYGDTSFTLTATGMTTSPTGTAYATRIGRNVTLSIPWVSGTSNSTSFLLTGIPAGWRPAFSIEAVPLGAAVDNGSVRTVANGIMVDINAGGSLQFYNSGSVNGWTSSGTKGIGSSGSYQQTISYNLQ